MKSRVLLLSVSLLAACSSAMLLTLQGSSSAAPDDVYTCVQEQFKTLGYRRMQYDALERWFVGQKEETDGGVASGQYRKTLNILDTRVRPDAAGTTTLEITAKSLEEYSNARGIDRQERKPTNQVKLDARTLQQACAP